MLPLDDPRWSELSDAYGQASRIPELLAAAEKLPDVSDGKAEPYFSLWSALCDQGDAYSASYAALPHLVRIIESNPDKFRWTLLLLVHAIETARAEGRGQSAPAELMGSYRAALAHIPTAAARLLTRDLNEVELRVILAACATAKGFSAIGEAIAELTPEATARFLADQRDR